jgi:hypothetical protein
VGYRYLGALKQLETTVRHERKLQMLMRGMTEGVISERDRLLTYTIGEFYQELSLFLEECAKKKEQLEKLKKQN